MGMGSGRRCGWVRWGRGGMDLVGVRFGLGGCGCGTRDSGFVCVGGEEVGGRREEG